MGKPKEFKMPAKGKILMGKGSPKPVGRPSIYKGTDKSTSKTTRKPMPKAIPMPADKRTKPVRRGGTVVSKGGMVIERKLENKQKLSKAMPSFIRKTKPVTRRGGK